MARPPGVEVQRHRVGPDTVGSFASAYKRVCGDPQYPAVTLIENQFEPKNIAIEPGASLEVGYEEKRDLLVEAV